MKTFMNIIKIIAAIVIISLIIFGIVMIVKNISSLSAAFEGESQTVIDASNTNSKNNVTSPGEIVTQLESIIF